MRRVRLCVYLINLVYLISLILSFFVGFKYGILEIDNGAMIPYLHVGDKIVYKELDTLSVGDVVVYRVNDDLVCRRLVQEIQNGYITKADAVPTNDSILMYKDCYAGTVIHVVRNGVALGEFLHSSWLLLLLVAVTVVVWAS